MNNYAIIKNGEILKIVESPILPELFQKEDIIILPGKNYVKCHWNYDYKTKQFYEFSIPL